MWLIADVVIQLAAGMFNSWRIHLEKNKDLEVKILEYFQEVWFQFLALTWICDESPSLWLFFWNGDFFLLVYLVGMNGMVSST